MDQQNLQPHFAVSRSTFTDSSHHMMNSVIDKLINRVAEIAFEVSSGLRSRREYIQQENPSQEKQLQADVWANRLFREAITSIEGIGEFASEEEQDVISCGSGLSVTIDPLDGSSNIPTNNIVGTIVGVYSESLPCRGKHLEAGFYVVYGPISTLTIARNGTVNEYAREEDNNEQGVCYYQTREDHQLPEATIYGFGGREEAYSDAFKTVLKKFRKMLKLRYGGALVGDANQVLHNGGIFGYPGTENQPEGKLRLLYEANPVSYIFEQAGGASSDGDQSVREIEPDTLHQRTPLFIGNKKLIHRLEQTG